MANPVENQNLSELNVQELLEEEKKQKSALTFHAFLIGLAVGIAVYSTVKHGFGFFAFFPLLFIASGNRASNKLKSVRAELKSRDL